MKKVICALMSAALLFLLAGCGGGDAAQTPAGGGDSGNSDSAGGDGAGYPTMNLTLRPSTPRTPPRPMTSKSSPIW